LNTGTIEASFQISGISLVCKDILKIIDRWKAMLPAAYMKKKQEVHQDRHCYQTLNANIVEGYFSFVRDQLLINANSFFGFR